MVTPELRVLSKIAWQFFATLTFKNERLPERVRLSLFFALLREFCAEFDLKFPYLCGVSGRNREKILAGDISTPC
jgi:hypothetical protein